MPAPLAVDWNEVRTLALAVGVRESARQMGLDENAVKQRCRREGWLAHRHAARAEMTPAAQAKRLETATGRNVPVVPTAADALAKMGTETRSALASVASKAARKLNTLDESALLDSTVADVATKYTGMASKLHGWEAKQSAQSNGVVINIALAGLTPDMALECARMPQDVLESPVEPDQQQEQP